MPSEFHKMLTHAYFGRTAEALKMFKSNASDPAFASLARSEADRLRGVHVDRCYESKKSREFLELALADLDKGT